jgi:hypothetical protein
MKIEIESEHAAPIYDAILQQVELTKKRGSTRQRYNVDTWEPAIDMHRPSGAYVGDDCHKCGEPWPCQFLLNLLDSGLLAD